MSWYSSTSVRCKDYAALTSPPAQCRTVSAIHGSVDLSLALTRPGLRCAIRPWGKSYSEVYMLEKLALNVERAVTQIARTRCDSYEGPVDATRLNRSRNQPPWPCNVQYSHIDGAHPAPGKRNAVCFKFYQESNSPCVLAEIKTYTTVVKQVWAENNVDFIWLLIEWLRLV